MSFTKLLKKKKKPPPRPATPTPPQTMRPPPTRAAPPVPNPPAPRRSPAGTHRLANPNALLARRGAVGNAALTRAVTQQMADGAASQGWGTPLEAPTESGEGTDPILSPAPTPLTVPEEFSSSSSLSSSSSSSSSSSEDELLAHQVAVDLGWAGYRPMADVPEASGSDSSSSDSSSEESLAQQVAADLGWAGYHPTADAGRYGAAVDVPEASGSESDSSSSDSSSEESSEEEPSNRAALRLPPKPTTTLGLPVLFNDWDTRAVQKRYAGEWFSSYDFTAELYSRFAGDMLEKGLAQRSEKPADIWADKPRVRAALKRLWGWTDEDIDRYEAISRPGAKLSEKNSWYVDYLETDEQRAKYAVTPGAVWTDADGKQFTTDGYSSKFSGPGWAIFVMDQHGRVYAGQHKVGLFHHSSFMGGGDVAAAGELKVEDGKLVAVTAKSGHYEPTAKNTDDLLQVLHEAGVPLVGVRVSVWGDNGTVWTYDAEEFRQNRASAPVLDYFDPRAPQKP